MKNEITIEISNQKRIELVYQAVIALEAQIWAARSSQQSLDAAIKLLDAVEEAIYIKYSHCRQGGKNAK